MDYMKFCLESDGLLIVTQKSLSTIALAGL